MTYDDSNTCAQPARKETEDATATPGTPRDAPAKVGPPLLNTNARRHGGRSDPAKDEQRHVIGTLPPPRRRLQQEIYARRRRLWAEVLAKHGSVSDSAELAIYRYCLAYRSARLAGAWLAKEEAAMTLEQRLRALELESRAADRMAALRGTLGLDGHADPADAAAAHYAALRAGLLDATTTAENSAD